MSLPGTQTVAPAVLRSPRSSARQAVPFALRQAIDRASQLLISQQQADGHWVGELQGDTILESEYIMLMAFLGREDEERVHKAANYIVQQQLPDGAWSNYPGGPVDLSVSVKAYFALKLTGHDPNAPYMQRARELIRELGGPVHCNSFSKFYLALLGEFPYENCPSIPPEMIFLPRWFYFNIYAFSAWSRTIVVPLSIFYAHKPVRKLPPEKGISELFLEDQQKPLWPCPPSSRWLTWTNFFLLLDWGVKRLERWGPKIVRRKGIEKAAQWMLDHCSNSDGVGAIYPPIVYTVICLRCLGYADDSPEMVWALKQLEDLILEEEDTVRLQPCFSPVWDTALSLCALAITGLPTQHPALQRGTRWLIDRECRLPGDWSLMNPGLEPAGWFFEYLNSHYPDSDDTAMVLTALAKTGVAWKRTVRDQKAGLTGPREDKSASSTAHCPLPTTHPPIPAARRGVNWLLGMQNSDGGWAAFDRDINRQILTMVPFADHNAMLDPSCPDITARVLEALGHYGSRVGDRAVDRAIAFIRSTQDPRGCWLGRWGVNYLYGTWQVLIGLQAVGFDMNDVMVRRAVLWLKQVQQASGAWGETCASYNDPGLAGQGPATASQTAWALIALIAAGEADSPEVRAGIAYLQQTQEADGGWSEEQFTGTGFPKVFYLKYHMYRLYFPLQALARYAAAIGAAEPWTGYYTEAS